MVSLREVTSHNTLGFITGHFEFNGPVVDRFCTKPYPNYISPRTGNDYFNNDILPPPNFRRGLLNDGCLFQLTTIHDELNERHDGVFRHFDIHERCLRSNDRYGDRFPWDILTYVQMQFEGEWHECYMPINASMSHQIMTRQWCDTPEENDDLKRRLLYQQLIDLLYPTYGPIPSIYGLALPERFTYGKTDELLMGFPNAYKEKGYDRFEQLSPVKYSFSTEVGNQVVYFFQGRGARDRKQFLAMINSEPCKDYVQGMTEAWGKNFLATPADPREEMAYEYTMQKLMRDYQGKSTII